MSKLFKAQTFGIAVVLALLLTSNVAQAANGHNDPVVLLIKGLWRPVTGSPKISLPGINLGDGTWVVNDIHGVTSVPSINSQDKSVIGHVYSQITGCGCLIAYDLPGGAMLMEFTAGAFDLNPIDDGHGGLFYQETWDLTIDQATGIYAPYKGGHNHMVDRYDSLGGGTPGNPVGAAYESCYCIISIGGGLPLWWTMPEN